jgi:hypothetical protein
LSGLLREIPAERVIVAIDPGKVLNRVWVTDRAGLVCEPVSLPTSREGIEALEHLVGSHDVVFAIEATGSTSGWISPWSAEATI